MSRRFKIKSVSKWKSMSDVHSNNTADDSLSQKNSYTFIKILFARICIVLFCSGIFWLAFPYLVSLTSAADLEQHRTLLSLLTLSILIICQVLTILIDWSNSQRVSKLLKAEFDDAKLYIDTMSLQIHGVKSDTEQSVLSVLTQLKGLYVHTSQNLETIRQSGIDLNRIMEQQEERIEDIISLLDIKMQSQSSNLSRSFDYLTSSILEMNALVPQLSDLAWSSNLANLRALEVLNNVTETDQSSQNLIQMKDDLNKLSQQTTSITTCIADKITQFEQKLRINLPEDQVSLELEGGVIMLRQFIDDLGQIQKQFKAASFLTQESIHGVDTLNQEIQGKLMHTMSIFQFQDFMRQRLEQVQAALLEMSEHLQWLTDKLKDPHWDGVVEECFQLRLKNQLKKYVMAAQIEIHHQAAGKQSMPAQQDSSIELF